MITLRQAKPYDVPTLVVMMEDHAGVFLDDYHEVGLDVAQSLIASGDVIAFDRYGLAVGFAWFADKKDDLHVMLHCLIEPKHYREAKQGGLFTKLLDRAFVVYDVGKIKAMCMHTQKSAIRLLSSHKFKQNGLFRNETKRKGKKVDVMAFELHRKFWNRFRQKELETTI